MTIRTFPEHSGALLYALLHYDASGPKWIRSQVAGRRPVDVPGMTSRVEVAIETALGRLG